MADSAVVVTHRRSADGKHSYEEIVPATPLAAKVTLGRGIDQENLARAEAAVAALAVDYLVWAEQDVSRMREMTGGLAARPDRAAIDRLYAAAHDVKGQGGSFGYPLVTAIGSSLCRALKHLQAVDARALAAIEAHLDAITLVLTQRLVGMQGERGAGLVGQLTRAVDLVVGPALPDE